MARQGFFTALYGEDTKEITWQGLAWRGKARQGAAGQGFFDIIIDMTWHGRARRGGAWHGKARQGFFINKKPNASVAKA